MGPHPVLHFRDVFRIMEFGPANKAQSVVCGKPARIS